DIWDDVGGKHHRALAGVDDFQVAEATYRAAVAPLADGADHAAAGRITIVGQPADGIIRIAVANAKTATLECGRYLDALPLTMGDVISPLWVGQILVPPIRDSRLAPQQWGELRAIATPRAVTGPVLLLA